MDVEKQARLEASAWTEIAYARFIEGGVAAVRIEPLAKALGVTRGSFYWHFKNRDALLGTILERWRAEQTKEIIAQNEASGGPADARLLRLLKTCAQDSGALEVGMRAWAGTDATARSALREIDAERIGYMTRLAEQAGVAAPAAKARCRVAYRAWLGAYSGLTLDPIEQRVADMETLCSMILHG